MPDPGNKGPDCCKAAIGGGYIFPGSGMPAGKPS